MRMSALHDDHNAEAPLLRPPAEALLLLPGGGPGVVRPEAAAATAGRRKVALAVAGPLCVLAGAACLAWRSSSASASAPAALFSHPDGGDGTEASHGGGHDDGHADEHVHSKLHTDPYAVLFPWFAQLIGLVMYLLLSRCAHGIPYTAVMFAVGLLFGALSGPGGKQVMPEILLFSVRQWLHVNGEVILLVFLPGLLYLDSFMVDAHIFFGALGQLLIFAFPMVLGGTTLTALVLYYVTPFVLPFDFCMMMGAILAATDPVAVAVLLNELGAPPRLKVHISGESLLNDGSAFVFFSIFKLRYLYLLGVDGVGENVGLGRGIAMFIQLAGGGALIGLAFGLGECALLFILKRRLSAEENVFQVASTITIAYLSFFTSEIVCNCSGIVAVVVCGVTVKTYGETLHNNIHLTHDFWHIAEHLLNTLLFFLAGALYGEIFTEIDGVTFEMKAKVILWTGIMFLFALVIRFFLVFLFYPVTSRIGIGQSWQEAVFMSYSGLRGAVGIALAISVFEEVAGETSQEGFPEDKKVEFNTQVAILYAITGGIAFLTLVVLGPTAGPLLKWLGLVTPTQSRDRVVKNYEQHMKQHTLVEYLKILADPRFGDSVDYAVIRHNVSPLRNVTQKQLVDALAVLRTKYPGTHPNLKNLLPYLVGAPEEEGETSPVALGDRPSEVPPPSGRGLRETVNDLQGKVDADFEKELRRIFINLLRAQYHHQIGTGELEPRGLVPLSLLAGVEESAEAAQESGEPLATWRLAQGSAAFGKKGERALRAVRQAAGRRAGLGCVEAKFTVLSAIAHMRAHAAAAKIFEEEFSQVGAPLTTSEMTIVNESKADIREAQLAVGALDEDEVNTILYQWVCKVLLNKSAKYFEDLLHAGLMTEKEASGFLEKLEHEMFIVLSAEELDSEGLIDAQAKFDRLHSSPGCWTETPEVLRDLRLDSERQGEGGKSA